MDKKYPLEAHLLSRTHPKEKVLQLLESRYAINSNPTLSFIPVEHVATTEDNRSLMIKIREERNKLKRQRKSADAKVVFKEFIKRQQHFQNLLKIKTIKYKKANNVKKVDESQFKEYQEILKFDDFLKLNELWIDYVKDLLQIKDGNIGNIQQTLTRLSSADFNGCFMRVLKSKNKEIVGKAGIVIYDSKNFFIIVETVNKMKLIEKKGTIFSFVIPLYDYENEDIDENDGNYLEFSIIGSRFQYRSHERSGKKFKSRSTDDLLYDGDKEVTEV